MRTLTSSMFVCVGGYNIIHIRLINIIHYNTYSYLLFSKSALPQEIKGGEGCRDFQKLSE